MKPRQPFLQEADTIIYRTISGTEYNLKTWQHEQRALVRRLYRMYCLDVRYEEFAATTRDAKKKNQAFKKSKSAKEVNTVLKDMKKRLGARQGRFPQDWEGTVDPTWSLVANIHG